MPTLGTGLAELLEDQDRCLVVFDPAFCIPKAKAATTLGLNCNQWLTFLLINISVMEKGEMYMPGQMHSQFWLTKPLKNMLSHHAIIMTFVGPLKLVQLMSTSPNICWENKRMLRIGVWYKYLKLHGPWSFVKDL